MEKEYPLVIFIGPHHGGKTSTIKNLAETLGWELKEISVLNFGGVRVKGSTYLALYKVKTRNNYEFLLLEVGGHVIDHLPTAWELYNKVIQSGLEERFKKFDSYRQVKALAEVYSLLHSSKLIVHVENINHYANDKFFSSIINRISMIEKTSIQNNGNLSEEIVPKYIIFVGTYLDDLYFTDMVRTKRENGFKSLEKILKFGPSFSKEKVLTQRIIERYGPMIYLDYSERIANAESIQELKELRKELLDLMNTFANSFTIFLSNIKKNKKDRYIEVKGDHGAFKTIKIIDYLIDGILIKDAIIKAMGRDVDDKILKFEKKIEEHLRNIKDLREPNPMAPYEDIRNFLDSIYFALSKAIEHFQNLKEHYESLLDNYKENGVLPENMTLESLEEELKKSEDAVKYYIHAKRVFRDKIMDPVLNTAKAYLEIRNLLKLIKAKERQITLEKIIRASKVYIRNIYADALSEFMNQFSQSVYSDVVGFYTISNMPRPNKEIKEINRTSFELFEESLENLIEEGLIGKISEDKIILSGFIGKLNKIFSRKTKITEDSIRKAIEDIKSRLESPIDISQTTTQEVTTQEETTEESEEDIFKELEDAL